MHAYFAEDFLTREEYVRLTDGAFAVVAPASAHRGPQEHEFLLRPMALDDMPETRWSLFHGHYGMTCIISTADGFHWRQEIPVEVVAGAGIEFIERHFGARISADYRRHVPGRPVDLPAATAPEASNLELT